MQLKGRLCPCQGLRYWNVAILEWLLKLHREILEEEGLIARHDVCEAEESFPIGEVGVVTGVTTRGIFKSLSRIQTFSRLHCSVQIQSPYFLGIFNKMSQPKSIILTGASRGIGLAVARYLLGQKHNVFLVARTKEPMEELKKEFPGQVEFLSADLADFEVCIVIYCCSHFRFKCTLPHGTTPDNSRCLNPKSS